uniref:DUF229 domain containing protein n=1 Tax=Haemonchus contortus TaxID=6289 RepID=A0A7I4YDJ8_HAECO
MRNRLYTMLFITCSLIAVIYYLNNINTESSNSYLNALYALLMDNVTSIFDTCPLYLYNHLDITLLGFYHPTYNRKLHCKVYKPITQLVDGYVLLSNNASNHTCHARCIFPKKDRGYNVTLWVDVPSEDRFECDIVETECTKNDILESFLHMQIVEQKNSENSTKPDVYVLIIDSASSFMVKRSLPKTLEYLRETMGGVQMEFLNKVGDNSRPNGFPLAFGKSIEGGNRDLVGLSPLVPDWNDAEICSKYLDEYPYYLQQFKDNGYKTMIAQDYDVGFVYYPDCLGFNRSEADHLWRPFDIRSKESSNFKKSLWDSCSETHTEMLSYMEKFMNSYTGTPKIAQVWPTTLAHETLKDLYHTDVQFLEFFQRNRATIDRSFFFFMGDHGPRRDGIGNIRLGQYENLNPFLMVMIPAAYRSTPMHLQLKQKVLQLITNFDIHATLMDILKLEPPSEFWNTSYRSMEPLSKGSSLFREWKGPRNCRTLPIPSQYCICQYDWTNVDNQTVQVELGDYFAEQLNLQLTNGGVMEKCQRQFYNRISSMRQLYDQDDLLYDVVVYLSPSNGLFSAFIRRNASGLSLGSGFSRLDRYGRQGDCLVGNTLRPLCHCNGTTIP